MSSNALHIIVLIGNESTRVVIKLPNGIEENECFEGAPVAIHEKVDQFVKGVAWGWKAARHLFTERPVVSFVMKGTK